MPSILLDDETTITSATLTATMLDKWSDGSLSELSSIQTYGYSGNGVFEYSDLSEVSLMIAETDTRSVSNGSTFSVDITEYINSLTKTDGTIIGVNQLISDFIDGVELDRDFTLNIEFNRTE